ncbi:MAG: hypothetical protein KBF49_11375, partial [Flavobacteriales bacterium]|nr:hypothetical protein [Flavobacteriales bacterium]
RNDFSAADYSNMPRIPLSSRCARCERCGSTSSAEKRPVVFVLLGIVYFGGFEPPPQIHTDLQRHH